MEAHKEEEQDPLAAMPPVPAQSTFEAKDPEPYDAAKRLPPVDEDKLEAMTNAADKERLQGNLKSAGAHRWAPCTGAGCASSRCPRPAVLPCGRTNIACECPAARGAPSTQHRSRLWASIDCHSNTRGSLVALRLCCRHRWL